MSMDESRELIVLARRGGRSIREEMALMAMGQTQRPAAATRGRPASARAGGSTASRSQSSQGAPGRRTTLASSSGSAGPGSRLLAPSTGVSFSRSGRPGSANSLRQSRNKDVVEDPLHNFKEKLESLVEAQQDLDFCEKPFFRPALWEATWKNHETIVRLLADKKASVGIADYQGRTPLHEAAYYGHLRLIDFLLSRGHPIDCADHFGQTPLFRAVEAGRHAVVEDLVAAGAQVGLLDKDRVTARHVAAFGGMPHMAEWLLYHGAYKNRLAMDDFPRQRIALSAPSTPTSAATVVVPKPPPAPAEPAWQASSRDPKSREGARPKAGGTISAREHSRQRSRLGASMR